MALYAPATRLGTLSSAAISPSVRLPVCPMPLAQKLYILGYVVRTLIGNPMLEVEPTDQCGGHQVLLMEVSAYVRYAIKNLLTYLFPVFILGQSLVGISAVMLVVIYRHLGRIRITCHRAIM